VALKPSLPSQTSTFIARNVFSAYSVAPERQARAAKTNGQKTLNYAPIAIRSVKSTSIARFVSASGPTTLSKKPMKAYPNRVNRLLYRSSKIIY